ncbi:NADH-quinone oxidoreductase subunit H [Caldanaerobacter subterraneus subsp. tengcongensis MB4]|uniref:NADH:ubiquinone oxidoreductase subunit 1 (Chain H) n=3 Tax=Caldanaerobacter subterraneus TaxID=911092 RepID=Q8RDB7_CALS4|nr:complex I subunit 1 family protein [Caldanaerobacter subterraneus]AAM23428.1 NADH:ubiquinone oxidoreductase subunit 1 (chain H) [Caldanaerobacter subterraneus subsp. tengcongensis MB4]MBE3578367.1 NADH-quinone oxidoreductase subunit H [Caldanaerobacter subterraneus]MCS3917094.1 NADH-quinone oxidoreductase subunit H [Caldanaerobacter subterraneus subsp. tengcongensis MB4]
MIKEILIFVAAVILAPIIGGFLSGIDRKLTAFIQGRYGPPIWQPFYDIVKLLYKQKILVNNFQVFSAYMYLLTAILSVGLFAIKADLLMILFVMSVGLVFYIAGALSTKSPYSQVGAQRELMQMLAYEPMLIFFAIALYNATGSFNIGQIMTHGRLLLDLPLMFILLALVLTIKLKKSPFDLSASEHAHQELVRGILTDYSGPYLALIHIADWYEMVLILMMIAILWSENLLIGALIALLTFFLDIVLDNITARMTVKWMLAFSWTISILFTIVNIAYIYFRR